MDHSATAVVGTAEPLSRRERRMYLGAFSLFIFAESLVFVTLFAVRFLIAGTGRAPGINYVLGTALTGLFVASLLPVWRADRAIARGDATAMVTGLGVTFGLGLAALLGIFYDWRTVGLDPGSRYGGSYFLITGVHVFHIAIGLIFLAALWSSGRRGRFTPQNHWPVTAGTWFWTFIVAAWVGLFVVLFVV